MSKLIFRPVSIVAGLLAGLIGKKLFQRSVESRRRAGAAQARAATRSPIGMLALALAMEGALFRLVKGLAEHGSRHAFSQLTGSWPGERSPEAQKASSKRKR